MGEQFQEDTLLIAVCCTSNEKKIYVNINKKNLALIHSNGLGIAKRILCGAPASAVHNSIPEGVLIYTDAQTDREQRRGIRNVAVDLFNMYLF